MNPELKEYLDAMRKDAAELKASLTSMAQRIEAQTAQLSDLCGWKPDLAGGVTGPVTASSGTTGFVLASAGLAEPLAPAPTIATSLVVAPAVPTDTIVVALETCSTECPSYDDTEPAHASTRVAAPTSATVTVDVIPLLAATAASDGAGEAIKGAASTAERSLAVTRAVPRDTTVVVHAFCSAECVTQVVTAASTTPATTPPTLLRASGSSSSQASSKQRPIPWPSFVVLPGGVHLTEPRPTLQESKEAMVSGLFSRGATVFKLWHIPWYSFLFLELTSEAPYDLALFQWEMKLWGVKCLFLGNNNYSGNICISTSCITIHDMFSARELRCWNDVLLLLDYGWCGSACVPSAHTVVVVSYEHLVVDSTDFAGSSLSAGSSVVGCSEFPVQSPIYFFIASESVTWVDTMDVHLLAFPCSALATICSACSQEPGHYLNNYQLKMLVIAAGHRMILVRFQKGQKNSHVLLLPWVWEQEEISLGFQFQQHNILHDWYLCNQSIMASVLPDYSLKYNLFADTRRSRLLCVRSVCAAVHALVFPDSKDSRSWQSAQPAIGCDALLPIIQSVVLICMDYWWLASASLTEIVSTFCARPPMQMELTWSVQTKRLPDYNKFSNSGHYQEDIYFSVGRLPYASHHSGEERAPEPFLKQEYVDVSFSSSFHMCTGMRMKPSEGCGELIQWLTNNQKWNIQWDPGGCMFALCSSGKRWTPPMYCHEELQWSSLRLACAFRIRFVTGTIDGLQFFMCPGQAPFQGGRNAIAVTTFLEQVSARHKYYLDFDQVRASDNYYSYLVEAYPNLGCYRESNQIKDRRLQWDPGGFSMMSAWGQAEFQGGRDVRTPAWYLMLGCCQRMLGCCHGLAPMGQDPSLLILSRRQRRNYPEDHGNGGGGSFFSHLGSVSPSPFMLVLMLATESMYQ